MYLLDTNVISEIRKIASGRCDENVSRWARTVGPGQIFLSAMTIQELETGVLQAENSNDKAKAALLRRWLNEQVVGAFQGRIIPMDEAVAIKCAALHVPDPAPLEDSIIAATALVHGLTVVTRNTQDFARTGVKLLNPWHYAG